MQTRNTPSRHALLSLARLAGLDDFSGLAKPVLFARLKEHNLDRLTRVRNRGLKRHASWADVAGGHGDALADGDAVMGSACSAGARLAARAPDALDGAKRPACGKGKRRRAAISQPEVLDPILLTELGPHKYKFVRPNGTAVLYNAGSLVDYILKTGDFTEPETRLEFSDAELRALDAVAAEAGLGKPSVLEAKQHPETYAERRTRRDAVVGVERCAGEVVSEMLAVVEQCEPEEGEMCLVMNLFPSFSDLYRQMADVDAEYSRQCIDHYRAFLRGPPNRPTRDRHGFLSTVITFLEQVENGSTHEHEFGF